MDAQMAAVAMGSFVQLRALVRKKVTAILEDMMSGSSNTCLGYSKNELLG